jgi:hypothetical protein
MSRITLSGNASGTGNFTLASPNSNTDRTLTLPDNTGTVLTTASTVSSTQIASALNASGSAPIYACRAWVVFNGTGTVSIAGSGNISSITDAGVGQYVLNFATAMQDINYCMVGSAVGEAGVTYNSLVGPAAYNTGSLGVTVQRSSTTITLVDATSVNVAVFR